MMASKAWLVRRSRGADGHPRRDAAQGVQGAGLAVRGFDEATWRQHRFDIVTVEMSPIWPGDSTLRAYLQATGEEILVEASPTDCVGVSPASPAPRCTGSLRWRGQNPLGFALMRARSILRRVCTPSLPARLTA